MFAELLLCFIIIFFAEHLGILLKVPKTSMMLKNDIRSFQSVYNISWTSIPELLGSSLRFHKVDAIFEVSWVFQNSSLFNKKKSSNMSVWLRHKSLKYCKFAALLWCFPSFLECLWFSAKFPETSSKSLKRMQGYPFHEAFHVFKLI